MRHETVVYSRQNVPIIKPIATKWIYTLGHSVESLPWYHSLAGVPSEAD